MSEITVTEVSTNPRKSPYFIYPKYGRPYLSTTFREYNSKPRLYMSIEGENIMENFAFRWDRPWKLYRKMLPEILAKLGLPEGTKASWKQKAGCSCGCSPGFILDIPAEANVSRVDFWATISGEGAKVSEAPAIERVIDRAEALKAVI